MWGSPTGHPYTFKPNRVSTVNWLGELLSACPKVWRQTCPRRTCREAWPCVNLQRNIGPPTTSPPAKGTIVSHSPDCFIDPASGMMILYCGKPKSATGCSRKLGLVLVVLERVSYCTHTVVPAVDPTRSMILIYYYVVDGTVYTIDPMFVTTTVVSTAST